MSEYFVIRAKCGHGFLASHHDDKAERCLFCLTEEHNKQSARIAELEAALRGLLAVSCPPRTCGENCRYCDETSGHTAECEYGKAEQAAQKALGGE